MKKHQPQAEAAPAQRRAASEGAAGRPAPADSPRQSAQGAQLAQLRAGAKPVPAAATSAEAPVQRVEGERKAKGHSLGPSHSKNRGGKITSHKAGKARTEDPGISAAKNGRRRRMMEANVSNSIAKSSGKPGGK
ncbi:hypothetical protein CDN99_24225 [Roseateles aquatilis]|uniref:Uncharacterized protein n=1 Tax=Roseateles aquatilis TaxID=431061 RepID=A0A246IW54_9BURK|nr:hypothetical protein [Roseateles aquatilis]OWQ84406.1 hypothetical protein CDN99_24225 [Roseateles aquatilis]